MAFADEMRLYDDLGHRLYCTNSEVLQFLDQLKFIDREKRLFCKVLVQTGARPTEVRQLTVRQFDYTNGDIIIRSLKKRKTTASGKAKKPQYRAVPVPSDLLEDLDLVFNLRKLQTKKNELDNRLWSFSRPTAYRAVTKVFEMAGIKGAMANPKGLRHAFGVRHVMNGMDLGNLAGLMGHSSTDTTQIYTRVTGEELRELALKPFKE